MTGYLIHDYIVCVYGSMKEQEWLVRHTMMMAGRSLFMEIPKTLLVFIRRSPTGCRCPRPLMEKIMTKDIGDRLLKHSIMTEDGCWLWTGTKNPSGYGRLTAGSRKDKTRKTVLAHRAAYERFVGKIPRGMCVCHHCDTPDCINPQHLFVGTRKDNADDRERKGRNKPFDFGKHEEHPNAKLSWKKVKEIRSLYPKYTQMQLGDWFDVSHRTISDVVTYKTWTPEPPEENE